MSSPLNPVAPCVRCECVREIIARDLCSSCYTSWKRWMNPDQAKRHSQKYRETHREHIREYQRNWEAEKRNEKETDELRKDSVLDESNPVSVVSNERELKRKSNNLTPSIEVGEGSFNIAIQTPTGKGWIIGEFKLKIEQDETQVLDLNQEVKPKIKVKR